MDELQLLRQEVEITLELVKSMIAGFKVLNDRIDAMDKVVRDVLRDTLPLLSTIGAELKDTCGELKRQMPPDDPYGPFSGE